MEMRNNNLPIRRGHIFWAELKTTYKGSLVQGLHPVLVVSNNTCNKNSTILSVVPLTSQVESKGNLPTQVLVEKKLMNGLNVTSIVQCEQVISIPKNSLGDYIGSLDTKTMGMINDALSVQLATGDSTYRRALKETANKMAEGIRFYVKMIDEYKGCLDETIIEQSFWKMKYEITKLENFCDENRLFVSDFYKRNDKVINSLLSGVKVSM